MISPRYIFKHEPNASKDNLVVKNNDDNLILWQEKHIILDGLVNELKMSVTVDSQFFAIKDADNLIATLEKQQGLLPRDYDKEKIHHVQKVGTKDDMFVLINAILNQEHKNGSKSATKLPAFLYVFNELGEDNKEIGKNVIKRAFDDYLDADYQSAIATLVPKNAQEKAKDWGSLAVLIGVIVVLLTIGVMSQKKSETQSQSAQTTQSDTKSMVTPQANSNQQVSPIQAPSNSLLGSQAQTGDTAGDMIAQYGAQQRAQYTDPNYHAELTRLAKEETLAKIGIDTKKMQEDMSCWVN